MTTGSGALFDLLRRNHGTSGQNLAWLVCRESCLYMQTPDAGETENALCALFHVEQLKNNLQVEHRQRM